MYLHLTNLKFPEITYMQTYEYNIQKNMKTITYFISFFYFCIWRWAQYHPYVKERNANEDIRLSVQREAETKSLNSTNNVSRAPN